jgi:lysophospholipase L1-like esterase
MKIRQIRNTIIGLVAGSLIAFVPAASAVAAPIEWSDTTTVATTTVPTKYVALGDSVAAGLGLTSSGTPTAEDTLCGRSAEAYPQFVAAETGMQLTHVACSGAHVSDLYNSQNVNGNSLLPQIDAAFANGTPDVITLTVGANDLHWAELVRQCYGFTCGTSQSVDRAAKVARGYVRTELFWALAKIQYLSNGAMPKVVLTGYFIPFADGVTCSDTQGLDASEITWLNDQAARLNRAIESVTEWFPSVDYAPVDFSGHELCTADPWVQGLQSPTSFHPTVGGQQAYAAAVREALND